MNAPPSTPEKGSWWRTIRAVAWSLLGLRGGAEFQRDVQRIRPLHIIAVGLLALTLLVGGLVLVVHWVV